MTKRSTLAATIAALAGSLWLPGAAVAETATYIITDGEHSRAEASCTRIQRQLAGVDCTVGRTQTSSTNNWTGPVRQGGFYAPGSDGDDLTYNPNDTIDDNFDENGIDPADPDTIKVAPRVIGTVAIDDNGTPNDGTDDTVLLTFSIQGATPEAGIVRNVSTGETTRVLQRFRSLDHTMTAPYPVDFATPNANGGFDYVIGSRGTVADICRALAPGEPPAGDGNVSFDPDDCFPSTTINVPSLPDSSLPPWYAPIPAIGSPGIERSPRLANKPGPDNTPAAAGAEVPNIGLTTVAEFDDSYECLTNSAAANANCDTGLVVWVPGSAGAGPADPESPGFDNVVGTISTGTAGITSAKLYWTQEYFIGAFGAPPGDNSYQAGAFTFTGVPQAANAIDDTATVVENSSNNVINVLANDIEFPVAQTTVTIFGDPANGTVTVNPDKTVSYTPDANFTGTDTFIYTATRPEGDTEISDNATVTVTVQVDIDPVATPLNVAVNTRGQVGAPVSVAIPPGNLGNTPASVSATGACTVVGTVAAPQIRYTPAAGFLAGGATDTCNYTITDQNGDQATSTVTATITDETPVLNDGVGTGDADGATANATFIAGNGTVAAHQLAAADGANGTCVATFVGANVRVDYTPNDGFDGEDQCVVTITDADGDTDTGNFVFTIEANDIRLPGGSSAIDPLSLLLLGGLPLLRRRKPAND